MLPLTTVARAAAFVAAFEDTLKAPLDTNTPTSRMDALLAAMRFLDWTLPGEPKAAVTDATCASITQLCAAVAAHAWAISEEIAARPRAQPENHPAGENRHAD